MIKNYLKTAFRNFTKDIRFSVITLIGFALGLFSFLIIIFYVNQEARYDSFHENASDIYRMGWEMKSPEEVNKYSVTTAAPAPDMYGNFPQITAFCRFSYPKEGYISYEREDFQVKNFFYTDTGFFDIFSYDLLLGNPETCLKRPYSLVLKKSLAEKIFRNENPLGKVIKWDNQHTFTVTGVIEDPPPGSHIKYSALASFSTLYTFDNYYMDWNGGVNYFSYFLFKENTAPADLGKALEDFYYDKINYVYEAGGWKVIPRFIRLTDIHLHEDGAGNIGPRGNATNNNLFLTVAFIILILACVNFMSLSTAKYSARVGEVAVRKVFGAKRSDLIRQFLGESFLLVTLAVIIAFILIEASSSLIVDISGTEIDIYGNGNLLVMASVPLIIFITALIAGSYPAIFLSSFKPVSIFRNQLLNGKKRISFRNIMVVFQFSVSIALIISTIIVISQMRYMFNKNLGFDYKNMIVLQTTSSEFQKKHVLVQEELSRVPGVISTAATAYFPGIGNTSEGYKPEGYDKSILINRIAIDHNYPSTMGLEFTKGRPFSLDYPTDSTAIIVNESLVRKFGWKDPVGKIIQRDGDREIIGVVKDFHYSSLHSPIDPLILNLVPYYGFQYIIVKYKTNNFSQFIADIRKTWKEIDPDEPFDYLFLNEQLKQNYKSELKFSRIFLIFAVLATILASLGLFGLAAFDAEKRKKEIGIRKILGSTVNGVASLLISNFLKLVFISNLLAWPVAYFLMKHWLENFEYRTKMNILIFISATVLSILIAVVTVWSRSYRMAKMNPANSIRNE